MKIRMDVEGMPLTASLDDTEAARDFVSLLPLALTLEDYASTEKIADLPRKLSTKGAPAGTAAVAGDFSYYAPWGNLALFYKPFRYSDGLVRLGTIDSGVEALRRAGPLHVRIRLSEDEGR
jgi:hypothetical protein